MVLGILTITAIPVTVGVAEGVHHQRKANEEVGDDASRMAKFNLEAYCDVDDGDDNTGGGGRRRRLVEQLNGKNVVLRDGKAWLDEHKADLRAEEAFVAECFYITYPDDDREKTLGLVSRISSDPPTLNWLYVNSETLEVRYGNRTESRPHYVGNWDWTTPDGKSENVALEETAVGSKGEGLVFDGFEGWVAVEEDKRKGHWALYFDKNDDGLQGVQGVKGKRRMNITLRRIMCDLEGDKPKGDQ